MKTLATLTLTCLLTIVTVQSQAQDLAKLQSTIKEQKKEIKIERKELRKLEGSKVAELAKTNFYADFGNVPNVEWKRSKTFDEATFTKDGQKLTAFYGYDCKLVGTTTPKSFSDLPITSQKDIKARYKDYSIESVLLYDDNEANESDMILWDNQFAGKDNYFVFLTKGESNIILMVNTDGNVSFFKKL